MPRSFHSSSKTGASIITRREGLSIYYLIIQQLLEATTALLLEKQ